MEFVIEPSIEDDMGSDRYLSERVEHHLAESARIKGALLEVGPIAVATTSGARQYPTAVTAIVAAARAIAESFQGGGKLLLCGNGGSAADCQHMAAEFMNLLTKGFVRGPLPAVALTTDSSYLTAYGNDFNEFAGVFARQVAALGKSGDVLFAISTSGTSANVLAAAATAREKGMRTIALSGSGGGLRDAADIAILVPSTNVHHVQEAHLAIEHAICDLVEELLFRPADSTPSGEEFDAALV